MDPRLTKALILDIDGVLSPVHGRTTWGDDVVVGQVFGDVLISPTMTRTLRELTAPPDVTGAWLSSWLPSMRTMFDDYLGAEWPEVGSHDQVPESLGTEDQEHPDDWWKWGCLSDWLERHPHLRTVVWCDDDLAAACWDDPEEHATWIDEIVTESATRGVALRLIAPITHVGLTQQHLAEVAIFLK